MTSAQLKALKDSIPTVTNLFADGDGSHAQRGWNDPFANEAGSRLINWSEGIPPDYATPYKNGGKKVLRKDINAIGNLASRELYLLQHGGYHTFDERVAKAINGYPYGAFLDWYQPSTRWLRKVRCVKDGGNCFTPIDDSDHGVDSPDPHWTIVDVMDAEMARNDAGVVETQPLEVPTRMLVSYGGFALEIPCGTTVSFGQTVKSVPWIAPADMLIEIPLFIVDPPWATPEYNGVTKYTNPWLLLSGSESDESGTPYAITGISVLEISDDEGAMGIPLESWDAAINMPVDLLTSLHYRLCPRLFVKKGVALRLSYTNRHSSNPVETVGAAVLRFNPSEVI